MENITENKVKQERRRKKNDQKEQQNFKYLEIPLKNEFKQLYKGIKFLRKNKN